jgi:hypothetical protein
MSENLLLGILRESSDGLECDLFSTITVTHRGFSYIRLFALGMFEGVKAVTYSGTVTSQSGNGELALRYRVCKAMKAYRRPTSPLQKHIQSHTT